jgi:hypothetical protein
MATQKEMLAEAVAGIEKHEAECNLKYAYIKEQLSSGSKKFIHVENMIWGLYAVIISGGGAIISKLI